MPHSFARPPYILTGLLKLFARAARSETKPRIPRTKGALACRCRVRPASIGVVSPREERRGSKGATQPIESELCRAIQRVRHDILRIQFAAALRPRSLTYMKLTWTKTDEAPALASYSLLPI